MEDELDKIKKWEFGGFVRIKDINFGGDSNLDLPYFYDKVEKKKVIVGLVNYWQDMEAFFADETKTEDWRYFVFHPK